MGSKLSQLGPKPRAFLKASESSKETRSRKYLIMFIALLEHLLNRWLAIGACWLDRRDVFDPGINIDSQVTRPFP
jgi:hypothetical protein